MDYLVYRRHHSGASGGIFVRAAAMPSCGMPGCDGQLPGGRRCNMWSCDNIVHHACCTEWYNKQGLPDPDSNQAYCWTCMHQEEYTRSAAAAATATTAAANNSSDTTASAGGPTGGANIALHDRFQMGLPSHLFALLVAIGASVFVEFWKRERAAVEERWGRARAADK